MKTADKRATRPQDEARKKSVRLAAFEDGELSQEAVEQLDSLSKSTDYSAHKKGRDLPSAARGDLA